MTITNPWVLSAITTLSHALWRHTAQQAQVAQILLFEGERTVIFIVGAAHLIAAAIHKNCTRVLLGGQR